MMTDPAQVGRRDYQQEGWRVAVAALLVLLGPEYAYARPADGQEDAGMADERRRVLVQRRRCRLLQCEPV